MGTSHDHLDWPRLSYREQFKEEDEEADRRNDGKTTSQSGLAKTILQGTVQGGRRRGRQRKRWEGNIKELTGLEWNILLRKAENREEWRKLVVKSAVVPEQSARLRDR